MHAGRCYADLHGRLRVRRGHGKRRVDRSDRPGVADGSHKKRSHATPKRFIPEGIEPLSGYEDSHYPEGHTLNGLPGGIQWPHLAGPSRQHLHWRLP